MIATVYNFFSLYFIIPEEWFSYIVILLDDVDDYFLSRLPIVEKRLAQGGVRLAAILNRIFTPKTRIAQA